MPKRRGFYRNAVDEPLICADCGGMHVDALSEIGLRWKTSISTIGWYGTIGEGARIPTGYGIAYYEPGRCAAVIMPVPFNLIVGALRTFWWSVLCPPWRFYRYKAHRALETGFREGWEAHGGTANSLAFVDARRRRFDEVAP